MAEYEEQELHNSHAHADGDSSPQPPPSSAATHRDLTVSISQHGSRDCDRESSRSGENEGSEKETERDEGRERDSERSRVRDRSERKKTSGFDMAPPASAMLPGASAVITGTSTSTGFPGQIPRANPAIHGMFPNMFPLATSQATGHARRVYVGGLPLTANEQSVATFFSQVMAKIGGSTAGPGDSVVNVYINHDKKFAFVEMRSVEEASNAMALDGIVFEGVPVKVRRPTDYNPSLAATLGPSQPNPNLNLGAVGLTPGSAGGLDGPDRIFVGGLPYYFTETQIREILETFGTLRGFYLVKDRETGNSKGYAFCVYQDLAVTDIACAVLNGIKMGGKTLTVRRANQGVNPQQPELESILMHAQQQIALQGAPVNVRRTTEYNPSLAATLGPHQPKPNLNLDDVGLTPGSADGLDGPDWIFVGGLPYDFTETQIRKLLENYGPLMGFDLVKDRETGNSKGYAFCVYQDPAVTDIVCVALDGIEIRDKTITVRRADGRDWIFVGGLPYYFTETQIRELLEIFGPLGGFYLVKDSETGNSKGYAFCVYQDLAVTDIACAALNGIKMGDKTLTFRRANQGVNPQQPELESILMHAQQQIALQGAPVNVRRTTEFNPSLAATLGPSQPNPNLNLDDVGLTPGSADGLDGPDWIFVGGLPYDFTETQIRKLLENYGPLMGFDLVKDRETGNSKGYAFSVYQDPAVTDIVCAALDGIKIRDKTITVGRADGPDWIFVGGLPYYFTETQIRELLETFGPLGGFYLVKDSETGDAKGYAFCVYQELAVTDIACAALNGIKMGDKTLTVRRANQGAHPQRPKPEPESILMRVQQQIALQKLMLQQALVATKVVCLTNVVSADELKDDEDYEEILDDMRQECSKFGTLVNVVIPRPPSDGKPLPGVGKVFLEYVDVDGATKAHAGLNGRKFGRKVKAVFYPENKFAQGDYGG